MKKAIIKQYNIRLYDPELLKRLTEALKRTDLSANQWLTRTIRQVLDGPKGETTVMQIARVMLKARIHKRMHQAVTPVMVEDDKITIDEKYMIPMHLYEVKYQGGLYQIVKRDDGSIEMYEVLHE